MGPAILSCTNDESLGQKLAGTGSHTGPQKGSEKASIVDESPQVGHSKGALPDGESDSGTKRKDDGADGGHGEKVRSLVGRRMIVTYVIAASSSGLTVMYVIGDAAGATDSEMYGYQ